MVRGRFRPVVYVSGINDNVFVLYEEDYSPAGAGPMPGVGVSLGYCGCLCCFKVKLPLYVYNQNSAENLMTVA